MRELLYRGTILDLIRLEGRWEVVDHPAAVIVLAMESGCVLGVTQHRPAINKETWELPAGLIDPGETPAQAAARELAEETRLAGELSPLTRMYSSPGFSNEELYLFEATQLHRTEGEQDESESITVAWREPAKVWSSVAEGRIVTSAPTLVGLLVALGRSGREW
ncbi:MAG: NUDIX hydrolase [Truepera sp.]|nr:NUDIX hydrolase [Truepera sp.]